MSADAVEKRPASDRPTLSPESPWLGLLPYHAADVEFFRGRDREIEALERLVGRERVTVLHGASGMGKTSLIQAGLFPSVRREAMLPVYVCLDFADDEPDLIAQVEAAIARGVKAAGAKAPEGDRQPNLWEYFHLRGADFWTERHKLAMPLLVFDQFEELFTLGRSSPGRAAATEEFLVQLADLAEGRPPESLKERVEAEPETAGSFDFRQHHYKIVLSLREDHLAELEDLKETMPSVAVNRLRLGPMNGESALEVVAQSDGIIDRDVAERIVRFVAESEEAAHRDLKVEPKEAALRDLKVQPAMLSIFCRELNNKRDAAPKITSNLLEESKTRILEDFYDRSVSSLGVKVRRYIEKKLITVDGGRDTVAFVNAKTAIGEPAIDQLIARQLLRVDERPGQPRLELTHDRLPNVVQASRGRRVRRRLLQVAAVAGVVLVGLAWLGWDQSSELGKADLVQLEVTNVRQARKNVADKQTAFDLAETPEARQKAWDELRDAEIALDAEWLGLNERAEEFAGARKPIKEIGKRPKKVRLLGPYDTPPVDSGPPDDPIPRVPSAKPPPPCFGPGSMGDVLNFVFSARYGRIPMCP